MPNDHAPAADRGEILLSPRYLAASLPSDHYALLSVFADDSAWATHCDESSFTATSPCQRVTIRLDRTALGRGPHLAISARTGNDAPERWRADVAGNVPIEILAALIGTVASSLDTDPDHVIYGIGTEPDLLELYIDTDHWDYFEGMGLSGFVSRDDHAAVINRPPGSSAPPIQGNASTTWHVGACPEGLGRLWDVSFTEKTPPFVMHAIISETLDPEPIRRPASLAVHPDALPLVTARRTRPAPHRPAAPTPRHEPPPGSQANRTPRAR